ncbi:helix-turn-helix transcriptional regulator [Paenibacillus sp. FSL P2-0536]|uniref:helix-turn-helix domain-containing protein n=1 Tax=Paenibacillus TaxID=44249 RepID=UPI0004F88CA8|nr:helix-turn-helix transcriptional regulator [Paenibacillus odorifer]AIQ75881.1 hypothetical protein PODO_22935 [Paenibacillus odorifer]
MSDEYGKRLMEARKKSKLTQEQVMKRINVNNKTISNYENGISQPDFDTLRALCNLYEVSADWILDLKNPHCC